MAIDYTNTSDYLREQFKTKGEFPGFEQTDREIWKIILRFGRLKQLPILDALKFFSENNTIVVISSGMGGRNTTEAERQKAKELLEKYRYWADTESRAFGFGNDDFYQRLVDFINNP